MSTERDELAELLMSDEIMNVPDIGGFDYALHEADVILAAGYRKPRTITTAEELDALAVGSVIRSGRGAIHEKEVFSDYPDVVISLPATVLWEPK